MTDRPDGVDFLEDDPGDGSEEELPQHSSRLAAWRPKVEGFLRGRYGLPFVVVIGVLALLVGRALLHKSPARFPVPTSPPSNTSVTLNPSTGRVIAPLPRRTGDDPTRCPGLQCYTAASVPAEVRAAVRTVFPTATFGAVETIRLVDQAQGDPLWYRVVQARVGTASLSLVVQAHAAGDTADGGSKDDGHAARTYVDAPLRDWFVRLQLNDRSGTGEPFDQLSTLAADPRLLAV